MNTGKICSASEYLYLTDHALELPYHTHPFKIIFPSLLSNCTKSLQNENVIRLVRVILRIMLKTCPLDSKRTRTYCRKFIHSWILLYHIPSLICDKELQYPTGKWTCDSNFVFSFGCSKEMAALLLPVLHLSVHAHYIQAALHLTWIMLAEQ